MVGDVADEIAAGVVVAWFEKRESGGRSRDHLLKSGCRPADPSTLSSSRPTLSPVTMSSNGFSSGGDDGSFLFTSESVAEGHPGE